MQISRSYTGKVTLLITDAGIGEIFGVHIFGSWADMIAEICVAMKLESTIEELTDTIHSHPTVSEIIMEAAHDIKGSKETSELDWWSIIQSPED